MGNYWSVFRNTWPAIKNGTAREVVNELSLVEDEEENDPDFDSARCTVCGSGITSLSYWYYLKNTACDSNSKVACCVSHLQELVDRNDCRQYEIVEYTRCSAYSACRDLDNIRRKCEQSESLTVRPFIAPKSGVFCEPGEAGMIMAAHKSMQILDRFSGSTSAQFAVTYRLTMLVIILTLINTVIAGAPLLLRILYQVTGILTP